MNKDILERLEKVAQRIYAVGIVKPPKGEYEVDNEDPYQKTQELLAQCAAMREPLEWLASIDECGDGFVVGNPMNEEHVKHCPECQAILAARKALQSNTGRDLLDRLRRLEAVAKAAREYLHDIDAPILNQPTIYPYKSGEDKSWRLRQALAVLEEVNDESRDPQAARRD